MHHSAAFVQSSPVDILSQKLHLHRSKELHGVCHKWFTLLEHSDFVRVSLHHNLATSSLYICQMLG